METLANLESFVRSAEAHSFSAAARRLGLTPAAVSRNVARLEGNLGVRLFQRSTRRLTLTEAGERFWQSVAGGLESLQAAIAAVGSEAAEPAGTLKVSLAPGFGIDYIVPLLPEFLARYPRVQPDWRFDNRKVDLIAEGYDAAIGGGFELAPGVVARELARAQLVAVAAPAYLEGKRAPRQPADLADFDGIVRRSSQSGRLHDWVLRDRGGAEAVAPLRPRIVLDEPEAVVRAALLGLGVALIAMPHALPHLERGTLLRLLPRWHADIGAISLYFPSQRLLPGKTRAFVDFVVEQFRHQRLAQRFAAA
ncbi:MAG TPA: LysR family transcriptional regulator [Methylibium sp.]|nr:LysR family transcriptional regulator [Methylibium sp.]